MSATAGAEAPEPLAGRGPQLPDKPLVRPDPWKGFRGVCSAVLILEAIAVLLGVPVVVNFAELPGPSWFPTTLVVGYATALVLACGLQSRPWALWMNVGLQLVLVAGWFLHPAVGVIGLVFVVVWAIVWWLQRAVREAQESS